LLQRAARQGVDFARADAPSITFFKNLSNTPIPTPYLLLEVLEQTAMTGRS